MKISGITLFPFIFVQRKEDSKNKILINHETIHIRQQLELLIVRFTSGIFRILSEISEIQKPATCIPQHQFRKEAPMTKIWII
jgi:hypothetical protein